MNRDQYLNKQRWHHEKVRNTASIQDSLATMRRRQSDALAINALASDVHANHDDATQMPSERHRR